MDSKINTLLEKLNITEECKVCFNGAKLVKIVGNKEKTNYTFYIEIESTLSIENYKEFVLNLKESFASIENDLLNLILELSTFSFGVYPFSVAKLLKSL
jgi:hypothetical protein